MDPKVHYLKRDTYHKTDSKDDNHVQFLLQTITLKNGEKVIGLEASCDWSDQGHGEQKGQLFAKLFRAGREYFCLDLFGLAPHMVDTVSADFTNDKGNLGAFADCQAGDKISLWCRIGGKGHTLNVGDFRLAVNTIMCPAEGIEACVEEKQDSSSKIEEEELNPTTTPQDSNTQTINKELVIASGAATEQHTNGNIDTEHVQLPSLTVQSQDLKVITENRNQQATELPFQKQDSRGDMACDTGLRYDVTFAISITPDLNREWFVQDTKVQTLQEQFSAIFGESKSQILVSYVLAPNSMVNELEVTVFQMSENNKEWVKHIVSNACKEKSGPLFNALKSENIPYQLAISAATFSEPIICEALHVEPGTLYEISFCVGVTGASAQLMTMSTLQMIQEQMQSVLEIPIEQVILTYHVDDTSVVDALHLVLIELDKRQACYVNALAKLASQGTNGTILSALYKAGLPMPLKSFSMPVTELVIRPALNSSNDGGKESKLSFSLSILGIHMSQITVDMKARIKEQLAKAFELSSMQVAVNYVFAGSVMIQVELSELNQRTMTKVEHLVAFATQGRNGLFLSVLTSAELSVVLTKSSSLHVNNGSAHTKSTTVPWASAHKPKIQPNVRPILSRSHSAAMSRSHLGAAGKDQPSSGPTTPRSHSAVLAASLLMAQRPKSANSTRPNTPKSRTPAEKNFELPKPTSSKITKNDSPTPETSPSRSSTPASYFENLIVLPKATTETAPSRSSTSPHTSENPITLPKATIETAPSRSSTSPHTSGNKVSSPRPPSRSATPTKHRTRQGLPVSTPNNSGASPRDYGYLFPNAQKGPSYTFGSRLKVKKKERVPGPGQYEPIDVTKPSSPSWSMKKKLKDLDPKAGSNTPGPGSYNMDRYIELGKTGGHIGVKTQTRLAITPGPGQYNLNDQSYKGQLTSPSYSMPGRATDISCNAVPGPGAYQLPISQTFLKEKGAHVYQMNGKEKRFKYFQEKSPGPGDYNQATTIGNKSTNYCPTYSISLRLKTRPQDNLKVPGPGAYDRPNTAPAQRSYSIGKAQRFSDKTGTPGPGAYSPNLDEKAGPYIGERFSHRRSTDGIDSPGPANYFQGANGPHIPSRPISAPSTQRANRTR